MNLKNGKVFTSKFVGTGPSSYEKKHLPDRGLTKGEKRWPKGNDLVAYILFKRLLINSRLLRKVFPSVA
jgi:hypothetical protein